HDYQWQISSDNATWSDISGATSAAYTTNSSDGASRKYYRLMAQSGTCWDVASTTAQVDVSSSSITVTPINTTDNSVTLNWSPVGSGNYTISYSGPGVSAGSISSVTPPKTVPGLTSSTNYSFTVTQGGTGLSSCPASGSVSATTLCAAPTAVTVT